MDPERSGRGAPVGLAIALVVGGLLAAGLVVGFAMFWVRTAERAAEARHAAHAQALAARVAADRASERAMWADFRADEGLEPTAAVDPEDFVTGFVLELMRDEADRPAYMALRYAENGVDEQLATGWISDLRGQLPASPQSTSYTSRDDSASDGAERRVVIDVVADGMNASVTVALTPAVATVDDVLVWTITDLEVAAE